jgi:hypothetical protein
MAPQAGFEPATLRLTAECSTAELLWNITSITAWQRPTLTGGIPQLPSALKSLTSVFGMGTGVTSSPLLPDLKLVFTFPLNTDANSLVLPYELYRDYNSIAIHK